MDPISFQHPTGIILGPKTSPKDLERIDDATRQETSEDGCYFRIPPFEIGKHSLACLVYFANGSVTEMDFCLHDPSKYGSDWSDATQEKEELRAQDTDFWLTSIGYPTGDYPWGTVWAAFDLKGFSGGGGVRYRASTGPNKAE